MFSLWAAVKRAKMQRVRLTAQERGQSPTETLRKIVRGQALLLTSSGLTAGEIGMGLRILDGGQSTRED
jgi:hypothetical protein